MRIENNTQSHFGAKYVNKMKVGKLVNDKYEQVNASFVKIEKNNKKDLKALHDIAKYWEHDKYAINIYQKTNAGCSDDVYALTSQTSNFENLNPNEILGVCEIGATEFLGGFLDYLQVKPEFVYNIKPEYKGVGTAIINSLKKIYYKISLTSANSKSVKNFYERNEFMEYPKDSCFFTWYRDIFSNFYANMK